MFSDLHHWFDANIEAYGFFRPYKHFKGGMYPDPWHLSYAPLPIQGQLRGTHNPDPPIEVLATFLNDAVLSEKRLEEADS